MADSTPECTNNGGSGSRIRLPDIPVIQQELVLTAEYLVPLQIWSARAGDILIATDPRGTCYRTRVAFVDADSATLVPFAVCADPESPLAIRVYQAIPEKERFELVLQKLSELGARRIVPFTCHRSISLAERDAKQKKSHRWPAVIWQAARQCRRAELPELWSPLCWEDCLRQAAEADLALLFYEGEKRLPLSRLLSGFKGQSVAILIGPEGGFTKEEVEQAGVFGIEPVGLGPRILRTETAAISAMTVVQYELGDLRLC